MFKTKKELDSYLFSLWDLPSITGHWGYSWGNIVDLSFLIGKNAIRKDKKLVITRLEYLPTNIAIYDEKNKKYYITQLKLEFFCKILNKLQYCKLDKTSCFFKGFLINKNLYKSLYYKTSEYKEKQKETKIKKYGSIENYESKRIKKVEKTMLKKYGVKSFLHRGKHYKKIENIMLEKYNTTVPILNPKLKQKISETIKQRYGVNWFLQRGDHYNCIKEKMFKRYGVENLFYDTTWQQNRVFTKINVSKIEKKCFNEIINTYNLKNVFTGHENKQYKVQDYYLDFYDPENNLVIEFNGDFWHCNPTKYKPTYIHPVINKSAKFLWERDRKRKQIIINSLNCKFLTIWESDWENNKNAILSLLSSYISNK